MATKDSIANATTLYLGVFFFLWVIAPAELFRLPISLIVKQKQYLVLLKVDLVA